MVTYCAEVALLDKYVRQDFCVYFTERMLLIVPYSINLSSKSLTYPRYAYKAKSPIRKP